MIYSFREADNILYAVVIEYNAIINQYPKSNVYFIQKIICSSNYPMTIHNFFHKRSSFDIYLIHLTPCLGESLLISQRLCKSHENSNGLDINKQICDNHRDSSDKSCFIYEECL